MNTSTDPVVLGNIAAIRTMLAMALALTNRNQQDPRGSLRDVLTAIEEELAQSVPEFSAGLPSGDAEKMEHAARSAVLSVGRLSDAILGAMNAPPSPRR